MGLRLMELHGAVGLTMLGIMFSRREFLVGSVEVWITEVIVRLLKKDVLSAVKVVMSKRIVRRNRNVFIAGMPIKDSGVTFIRRRWMLLINKRRNLIVKL